MDIDKIFSAIWEGKEWIFSGIGVVALGFIGKRIIGKNGTDGGDAPCIFLAPGQICLGRGTPVLYP